METPCFVPTGACVAYCYKSSLKVFFPNYLNSKQKLQVSKYTPFTTNLQ